MSAVKVSAIKTFTNGFLKDNPTLKMLLGMCPALAVTTSAINGLGMGLAATVVLLGSNMAISLIRKLVPDKVRIPVFITVIAGFVTIVQMLLKAYLPTLDKALGIFIPLIVVNCIILARAEMFASKNNVVMSALDALGMGGGFAIALLTIGSIREILGEGSLFGIALTKNLFDPAVLMILPPGGFLTFGFIVAFMNKVSRLNIQNQELNGGCDISSSCNMNCLECAAKTAAKETDASTTLSQVHEKKSGKNVESPAADSKPKNENANGGEA